MFCKCHCIYCFLFPDFVVRPPGWGRPVGEGARKKGGDARSRDLTRRACAKRLIMLSTMTWHPIHDHALSDRWKRYVLHLVWHGCYCRYQTAQGRPDVWGRPAIRFSQHLAPLELTTFKKKISASSDFLASNNTSALSTSWRFPWEACWCLLFLNRRYEIMKITMPWRSNDGHLHLKSLKNGVVTRSHTKFLTRINYMLRK